MSFCIFLLLFFVIFCCLVVVVVRLLFACLFVVTVVVVVVVVSALEFQIYFLQQTIAQWYSKFKSLLRLKKMFKGAMAYCFPLFFCLCCTTPITLNWNPLFVFFWDCVSCLATGHSAILNYWLNYCTQVFSFNLSHNTRYCCPSWWSCCG